LIEKDVNQSVK